MNTEYSMIDPWGNSRRDFPSAESGMEILHSLSLCMGDKLSGTREAREYMETRTWDFPTNQVTKAIEELLHEEE